MKTKVINDITYYVIKDDNDILSNMDISDKLTEYFDDFDYIVGDISYSAIRLKGFYLNLFYHINHPLLLFYIFINLTNYKPFCPIRTIFFQIII